MRSDAKRIDVVTLFPQMFDAISQHGITRRAVERNILELKLWNPRDFATDRHNTVDDHPYGGGPGMVMMYTPLNAAIQAAQSENSQASEKTKSRVIYLSPQGRPFTQAIAEEFASADQPLLLIAGRYEGIDERLIESMVDEELSIGDFVLSGGEIAAMAVIDSVTRLLPGALGHEASSREDSFSDGLLEHPQYTRPKMVEGNVVPKVLMSGDHAKILRWRQKMSLGRTWLKRPDLLEKTELSTDQRKLLDEFIHEHKTENCCGAE